MKRKLLISAVLALAMVAVPMAGLAQPAEAGGCATVHVVRHGETLASVAAYYGVSPQALAQANAITNPDWVYVGISLCIPGQTYPSQPWPPKPQPPKPPAPKPTKCVYHTVRYGQTLSEIAKYYGVNMWTLAQRNKITNPNRIYAGQVLLIYCPSPPPPPPPPPPPKPPHPPSHPGYPCQPTYPGHPSCQPEPPSHYQCDIVPANGFGRVWHQNSDVAHKLGCPTGPEIGFSATQYRYSHGTVIEDNDSSMTYVLYNTGRWESYPNTCHGDHQHPCHHVPATRQNYERGQMLWTASGGIFVLFNDGTWRHYD